ncbi:MAG TPA: SDR family NAD(P)-dependent oxidoreductase [Baekduia sp.]|nr:SDR family NAD(P)-dependent oxidoreductase [Baekduia sp.]
MRAVVTGAAQGLGAGIAERLVRDGAAVAMVDRDAAVVDAARTAAAGARQPVVGLVADVADEAQVDRAVTEALDALGGVDLLVNCAGVGGPDAAVVDTDPADFRRTLEVNLVGPFLLCRRIGRVMMQAGDGGAIVNVGSLFGQQGVPHGAAYCASKGGVVLLTHSLAAELAPHGIRVNAIAPGHMATEMHFDELRARADRAGTTLDEQIAESRAQVPLGRHGTGEDLGGVVAWLASPDASYVTGQTIAVNGGLLFS